MLNYAFEGTYHQKTVTGRKIRQPILVVMYINFDFFHLDFFMDPRIVILELSGGIKIHSFLKLTVQN